MPRFNLRGCDMATLIQNRPVHVGVEAATLGPAVAPATTDPNAWVRYFEEIYHRADGDTGHVPWADSHANPALVSWLNAEAPSVIRPGAAVTVVGCGLGHDVVELAGRGYDVLGFDVSPTAIDWAKRLHPEIADRLVAADLFNLPAGLPRRADLVVEVCTLQALHPSLREHAAQAAVTLARPRGCVLAICRGRDEVEPLEAATAPPYPLTCSELCGLMEAQGWYPTRPVDDFVDDETPPKRRLRAAFKRR
ncbi:MAG: class I SAM-dependent methyltransferase [Phycisphaerales bacterium]